MSIRRVESQLVVLAPLPGPKPNLQLHLIARLLLAASMAATAAQACADPLFAPPYVSFNAGIYPFSLAVGDFNGDGNPDLATANYNSNTVSVLLGDGNGSFGVKTDYAAQSAPRSVAIGDLNGDGKLDLVMANNGSNSVSVLLGSGNGAFGVQNEYFTRDQPTSVAIGDLNGDGKPDLAVANFGGPANWVDVLLGNGDGSFGGRTDYPTGIVPYSIAIGDLNGDGKTDVVTADGVGMVSVLLGHGDGSLGIHTEYAAGANALSVAIGDLNGDGKPDLAVTSAASAQGVSVLLGSGDGSFGAKADYATGIATYSVAIGDLDGDGKPDLATANEGSSTVSVLLGNGDGSFGQETDYGTASPPLCVAIGDLNRDGRPDLAVTTSSNSVSVLLNTGDLPTPTSLALVDAHAESGLVELRWFGSSMAGVIANVYRQFVGAAWTSVATIAADGTGMFRFEDADVQSGALYGYRLGVPEGGYERIYGETWVSVPGDRTFALAAPTPNPALDRLAIAFTLPDTAPARLEVIDVQGRLIGFREVGTLGPGQHVVTFSDAGQWGSGIFVVRLMQGAHILTRRACIVR